MELARVKLPRPTDSSLVDSRSLDKGQEEDHQSKLVKLETELARTQRELEVAKTELSHAASALRHFQVVRKAVQTLDPNQAARSLTEKTEAVVELAQSSAFPEIFKWVTRTAEHERELEVLENNRRGPSLVQKLQVASLRWSLTSAVASRLLGYRSTVEMELLSTRNTHSVGCEAWIVAASSEDGRYFPLRHCVRDPTGSELRPDETVPFGLALVLTRPGRVQLLSSGVAARLTLLRNRWSGHVAITVSGRTQVVDLYSEHWDFIEVQTTSYPFPLRVGNVQRYAAPLSLLRAGP